MERGISGSGTQISLSCVGLPRGWAHSSFLSPLSLSSSLFCSGCPRRKKKRRQREDDPEEIPYAAARVDCGRGRSRARLVRRGVLHRPRETRVLREVRSEPVERADPGIKFFIFRCVRDLVQNLTVVSEPGSEYRSGFGIAHVFVVMR